MSIDQRLDADAGFEQYKVLLNLWSSENPIKTTKLQVLLAVNALLASVVSFKDPVVSRDLWLVYLAGVVVSLVWTFSIGRTALFQEVWQMKLARLASQFPDDPRFSILETRAERAQVSGWLRLFGAVPSRWYLLFTPPAFAAAWAMILVLAMA